MADFIVFIIVIGIIALAFYLLSVIWPFLVLLLVLFVIWKIYESFYYKGSSFLAIKQRIATYIEDCNELNRHIEDLKNTDLIYQMNVKKN